jgi:hypothetical protein
VCPIWPNRHDLSTTREAVRMLLLGGHLFTCAGGGHLQQRLCRSKRSTQLRSRTTLRPCRWANGNAIASQRCGSQRRNCRRRISHPFYRRLNELLNRLTENRAVGSGRAFRICRVGGDARSSLGPVSGAVTKGGRSLSALPATQHRRPGDTDEASLTTRAEQTCEHTRRHCLE